MKTLLLALGRVTYWCAWPVFWIYFKRSPGRTRVVVTNPQGEVLVLKQWISSGKWLLPGGGLHKGEEPLEGALRELKEEVGIGLRPSDLAALGQEICRSYGFRFWMHIYVTQVHEVQVTRQRIEIAEAQWLPLRALTIPHTSNDTLQALKLAGIQR